MPFCCASGTHGHRYVCAAPKRVEEVSAMTAKFPKMKYVSSTTIRSADPARVAPRSRSCLNPPQHHVVDQFARYVDYETLKL